MKRIILIISSIYIFSFSWADIITVSNNPDSPGQYTSLQTAIDAAMDGDTILIAGSPTSYGAITLDKKLRLIGAGIAPGYKQNAFTTVIATINLFANENFQGASGSSFEGIVLQCTATICSTMTNSNPGTIIKDITVDRCYYIGFTQPGIGQTAGTFAVSYIEDLNIRNSIFYGSNIFMSTGAQNIIISNNIFTNSSGFITGYITNTTNTSFNIVVSNNIFFGDDQFGSNFNIYRGTTYNITFSNNILYRISPDPYIEIVENCVFNNNISFGASSNAFSVTGSNTGVNNIENSDPQFVSIAPGATSFTWTDDLHIEPGSPGENAGVDGSNIGIYGGSFPFPLGGQYDAGPAPAIPEITIMNILNTALKKTDQLQVQIKANSNN